MRKVNEVYNKKNLSEMIFHKSRMTFHQDDLLAIYKSFHLIKVLIILKMIKAPSLREEEEVNLNL